MDVDVSTTSPTLCRPSLQRPPIQICHPQWVLVLWMYRHVQNTCSSRDGHPGKGSLHGT